MKKSICILMLAVGMTSCMSTKEIGKLNMISNRNVDSKADYVLIKNYAGGTRKELKRNKAETIEKAIDKVVKATPGGEFLKNVRIYVVNGKYFAVEGDIWGYDNTAKK